MSEDPAPSRRHRDPPSDIGPYRILQTLGEGGMGVVYEAEQTAPVRRRVALKVVRAGYDSRQIVARFEAERQALAVMDHPNIARVYEAGTTEEGLPYFAMELVKGTPITEYCDTQKLSTEERLRLFVPVCRAVQHAHHKGVIHRDLKPSNVLVTIVDRQPVPKVIDFGIAKAMGQDLTDKTLVTELGQLIGTPEYMSPEQAEMTGLDIDTRTDIYSLGVMLYELLVGARPLDLRHVAIVALWKAIREQMPPTPSSRLATLPGETQAAIALYRHTDASDLRKTLQGDLDWVAMKCLEKDRTRRYETANGLAVDLERFLRHEPVVARPPSAGYRLRKFVRRHRAGVAAALVALVAVSAGSAAAVVGMVSARRSEESAKRSEERAETEASVAKETSDFLVSLFEVSSPAEARGDSISARELLDRGAERIRTELEEQPLTQARLMFIIGTVYHSLGLYAEAESLVEAAIHLQKEELGPSWDLAESLSELGVLFREQGRYEESEATHLRSLAMREQLFGPDDVDVANVLNDLGVLYQDQGRYDDAIDVLKRAISLREQGLAPGDTLTAMSMNNLASIYYSQGRYEDAEPLFQQALGAYRDAGGSDHPYTLRGMSNLATLYSSMGDYERADSMLHRVLEARIRVLGPAHPEVGLTYVNLGNLYRFQEKYDEAEPLLRRAREILEPALGPDHTYVGSSVYGLSVTKAGQREYEEAAKLALEALSIWRDGLGPEHPNVALALQNLADIDVRLDKPAEAERLYREALAINEGAFGTEHANVAQTLEKLVELLRVKGATVEADSLEARARAIREAAEAGDQEASSGS